MKTPLDLSNAKSLFTRIILGTVVVIGIMLATGYILQEALIDSVPENVSNAIVSFALILMSILLVSISKRILKRLYGVNSITEHQREIAYRFVQISTYVTLVAILISYVWEINLGNILIGAGVLGVIIGFAAQKLLSSVFSGIIIMSTEMFRVGDWIEFGDKFGRVKQITFFNTKMISSQGEIHVIPNDRITNTNLTNISQSRYRNDIIIGVDYETDIKKAIAVCDKAIQELSESSKNNNISSYQPTSINEFDDSSITLAVKTWLKNPSPQIINHAQTEVYLKLKEEFEKENITIPFPQRTVSDRRSASVQEETENTTTNATKK